MVARTRKKKLEKFLKQLAIVVILSSVASFLFLRWQAQQSKAVPPPAKQEAGYTKQDRERLEQLIHEGAKND
jgi:hypothetical protein